ncbi:hypothetical protein ABW99_20585 [Pandoraea thiooxydans]|uniref:AsmA domain-containing protein n=1 Tax=Pandoraea thiooxydans TaxID=445709 RepID=A0A0U4E6Z6_9BURK|nr:AsmA family protein [Pandoraea thiooxydans]ALX34837.1 hypothetical protein ABW99_20585 [Pandoraea thiooxydans]
MKVIAGVIKWLALLVAAIIIGCAIFISVFNWNRARGWIDREVSAAVERPFAIRGDLTLQWLPPDAEASGMGRWLPRPRLIANDIVLGNPPWGLSPNMVEVQQASISLDWMPLLEHRVVLPEVALAAPHVDLERLADGRNNWTIKQSTGKPSLWRFKIDRLVLEDGIIRVRDLGHKLDLTTELATIDGQRPYGIGFRTHGNFNGVLVSGRGRSGDVLSLENNGTPFPLDAAMHIGRTTIAVQGTFTNPLTLAALDMRLYLSGPTMADLYPITGVVLPNTPPYRTTGRLVHSPRTWRYEQFTGQVGSSDLSGTLTYHADQPRPLLEGAVVSNLLRLADLGPLIGAQTPGKHASGGDLGRKPPPQPPGKVLPVAPFNTDRWRALDADVKFTGRKIIRGKDLPIENLVTHLLLRDGVLSLDPLQFGVAGGQMVSNITLDGRATPMRARMQMSLRHLKIKKLLPEVNLMKTSLGEVNGDVALDGTGNSVAALLGSSNGEVKALVDRGSISKLLTEYLGLNVGNIVFYKLFGDKQIEMRCAAADFGVDNGVMNARTFVIDTADMSIGVKGKIDMKNERFDLDIKPEPKHFGILSLRSPLYVKGTFKHPDVGVDAGTLLARAGGAIALGIVAPVSALLPLLETGPGENSPCHKLLKAMEHPASVGGATGRGSGNAASPPTVHAPSAQVTGPFGRPDGAP